VTRPRCAWSWVSLGILAREQQLATSVPDDMPSGRSVECLGTGAWIRCEPHMLETGLAQDRASLLQQSAGNPASLVGLIHKESPDVSIPRISRRKSHNATIFIPDEYSGIGDEPLQILDRHPPGIGQLVLTHIVANLGDSLDVTFGGSADQSLLPCVAFLRLLFRLILTRR
jgi:hypothetical protein